ncbi:MAG: glycosyltransferase, partial [Candidatus Limnocylindria bacterium]
MTLLDSLLLTAAVWLALSTALILTMGRRPLGRSWRPVGTVVFGSAAIGVAWLVDGAALAPSFTTLALAGLTLLLPRAWWAAGSLFFAGLLGAAATYAVYLLHATLLLGDGALGLTVGLILLGLELGAIGLIVASGFEMVDALCAAAPAAETPPQPLHWPVVCLQVPTYNEPPELVIETVRSLVALDYPALVVQVIDNNTTDEGLWRPVEAECARLRDDGHRVAFAHLPRWPGFKSGALNWGRAHLPDDVEIVGVIDADYVVEPGYLRATVPHFADDAVAFVQTPQDYRAWQGSGFYRACYVGFAYFFAVGMVSRARRNAIIFAGTMGLIRRSALDAIGGWDEAIITEDAEASLRIHALGHRAVYLPSSFGRGIMPLTYEGLRKQRFRWAFGGIQILRKHWRLLLPWSRASRLTLGQRYDYLLGGLWWFNDALTLGFTVFVAAAGLGLLLGQPFTVQRLSTLGIVLPLAFIGLNLVRYLWALRVSSGAGLGLAIGALRVNLSLSWVIALACARGLFAERGVFLRTPKFRGSARVRELRVVAVETAIALGALGLGLAVLASSGPTTATLIVAGLLGWSLLIYGSATALALTDPERAPLSAALAHKARLELA